MRGAAPAPGQPAPHDADIPLLRGVLHTVFCPVALAAGIVLSSLASSHRAAVALLVMSLGFAAMFATSAVYHRVRWTPRGRRRARQLDHAMIFLVIATSYSAIWLAALDGWIADAVLAYVWVAAVIGIVAKLSHLDARRSRHWLGYVAFSIVGLVVIPDLWETMGSVGVTLMIVGGVVFATASIPYVVGRPNPVPGWFEHHEIFHVGTILGCTLFLIALGRHALR